MIATELHPGQTGASLVDLYDIDQYVDQVIDKTDAFFKSNTKGC